MRILYVTQTFHPEPLSVERSVKGLVQLQRLGHEVTVLTTRPSFPFGKVAAPYRGKLLVRETHEGMKIVRVWSLPAANRGMGRRMISFLTFAIAAALVGIFLRRCDLVIANVPHPGTELAAIIIAKLRGSRLLLEMVDIVPDNLQFIGVSRTSLVYRVLAAYYRAVYRLADLIAVLCESAAEVAAAGGAPPERIMLWPNAADADLLASPDAAAVRREHALEGKFVVLYAGSFSQYYQTPNMVAAARLLAKTQPQVHFVLLGGGDQWEMVRETIERDSIKNVLLAGVVPRHELGSYLQAADLFIFSMVLQPTPRPYHNLLTAKACDYLQAGRPIVSVEDGAILGELLQRIGAGVTVTPGHPAALADAIAGFATDDERRTHCGRAGADYARENLMREKIMRDFEVELRARLRNRGNARQP